MFKVGPEFFDCLQYKTYIVACQPSSIALTDVGPGSLLIYQVGTLDGKGDPCGTQSLTEQWGITKFESQATPTNDTQSSIPCVKFSCEVVRDQAALDLNIS